MGDERGSRATAQRYVFGRIDQTTMSFNTRFNYTMTPNLSLQVYAEPFVSAGDYSNYKELVDGRAADTRTATAVRLHRATPTSTSARSAPPTCCGGNTSRARAVPGVAAGQAGQINDYGDFSFERDFNGVFSAPSHNTFLVKFTYWLNM